MPVTTEEEIPRHQQREELDCSGGVGHVGGLGPSSQTVVRGGPLHDDGDGDDGGLQRHVQIMQQQQHHQDSRFSCNICFEAVTEPVVTQCGHLYCWPCLYRWLEPGMLPAERLSLDLTAASSATQAAAAAAASTAPYYPVDESRRVCPVCKAGCSVPSLVPIYVRSSIDSPQAEAAAGGGAAADGEEKEEFSFANAAGANPDDEIVERQFAENEQQQQASMEEDVNVDGDDRVPPSSPTRATSYNLGTTGLRRRRQGQYDDRRESSGTTASSQEGGDDDDAIVANTSMMSNTTVVASNTTNSYSGRNQNRPVPARPAANSPMRVEDGGGRRPSRPNGNNGGTPQSPRIATTATMMTTGRPVSLSHGLALSLQQAIRHQNPSPSASDVPPLHRREGHGNAVLHVQQFSETDPDATEFLSRILLLLGSFVILCLLLF